MGLKKRCVHYRTKQRYSNSKWSYAFCEEYQKWESGRGTRDLCPRNCPSFSTKGERKEPPKTEDEALEEYRRVAPP